MNTTRQKSPRKSESVLEPEYVRTTNAIKFLDIGRTKFWNLVAQGYITVVRPEGAARKMGYVSVAELRRYQSGQMVQI